MVMVIFTFTGLTCFQVLPQKLLYSVISTHPQNTSSVKIVTIINNRNNVH